MTASCLYIASTYWKHASTTPLLDLPTVDVVTFLKVMEAPFLFLIQVRSTVLQEQRLAFTLSFWTYVPRALCLTSCVLKGISCFGSLFTLHDHDNVMPLLRLNMTSSRPLRLHSDRGLERHGYPWVPTDQGPRGLCQVDPTCQKPRLPASGSEDLIHNSDDLGRLQKTLPRS
jgi:hypothetical protein